MESQESIPCPRCAGLTWLEVDHQTVLQRCLCGLAKVIFVELEGGGSITTLPKNVGPMLPRTGSKLSLTLGTLASLEKATTEQIAERINKDNGYTASQLTVLQTRGLVLRLNSKKGVAGGSTWELSPKAKEKIFKKG